MLQRGDLVPHFEVRTLDGRAVRYADVWQHANLVLVAFPAVESAAAARYAAALSAETTAFAARNARLVMTRGAMPATVAPTLIIADRWGEIVHVATGTDVEALPGAADILDWLDHLESRCPECEGESR